MPVNAAADDYSEIKKGRKVLRLLKPIVRRQGLIFKLT
jgi:hypothetical protein